MKRLELFWLNDGAAEKRRRRKSGLVCAKPANLLLAKIGALLAANLLPHQIPLYFRSQERIRRKRVVGVDRSDGDDSPFLPVSSILDLMVPTWQAK